MDKKTIFLEALEINSAEERAAFLVQACAENSALRQDVEKLLRAHDQVGDFLEQPFLDATARDETQRPADAQAVTLTSVPEPGNAMAPRPAAGVPEGLRYRILRPHAKGGLGEVFVAEDRELHREVALKEIRLERADQDESRRRFIREAQITGALEHPGVVPVYGLGQYPDGRPFYAMRLIQGETLEEAIKQFHAAENTVGDAGERQVRFRKLLGRFISVCQAVAYAHSRGVVHRDLKPSNMMLGPYGETLVVDWGLAKPVGPRATVESTAGAAGEAPSAGPVADVTQVGAVVGSPAYMSPEQAAGRPDRLGPASDIYSLGVTLYVLLTGREPIDGDMLNVLRRVQGGDYPAPRQVKESVPKALEAICLKAMARSPEARYATPLDLAHDLENWLAGEPVSAWREPWTVRANRWGRRHQRIVGPATAAVLTMLLASFVGAFWYQQVQAERKAREASELSERRTRKAYLTKELTAALDDAEEQFRQLTGTLGDQRQVYGLLSDIDGWRRQVESARAGVKQARVVATGNETVFGPEVLVRLRSVERQLEEHTNNWRTAEQADRIRSNTMVGSDGGMRATQSGTKYGQLFEEALRLNVRQEAAGEVARVIRASPLRYVLVAALDDWALSTHVQGNPDREIRSHLLQVVREADPDPWRDRFRQDGVWNRPADLAALAQEADVTMQSPHILAALALVLPKPARKTLLQRALLEYPRDFWLNFGMAMACEDAREKAGYLQAALAIRPDAVGAFVNLGVAFVDQGRLTEAELAFRKARDLDPKFPIAHLNRGLVLLKQKRLPEAIEELRQAAELAPHVARYHFSLGVAVSEQQQYAEAIQEFRKAIDINPKYAQAYGGLGSALLRAERFAEAKQALAKCQSLLPKGDPETERVRQMLAECNSRLGSAEPVAPEGVPGSHKKDESP